MAAATLRRTLAAATLAAALVMAGCGRSEGGATRVAAIGPKPKLVDTISGPLSPGDSLLRSNMSQGLVRFDERGQVVPGLAERWNVSDDGLSYIFRLQTGEWQDGRKIRADEVARILTRQLRQASTNPLKDTLGAVGEIVAMTDRVIEIRLDAPRPNLLQLLAQPEFGLVRSSVGTGPFRFLQPEDNQAEVQAEKDPNALTITHRIVIPDAKDPVETVRLTSGAAAPLVAAFAKGDLDLVLGGTIGDLPIAIRAKIPRGALRFDPVAGLFGLAPTGRSDLFKDKDVRKLLSQAIDRTALVAALRVDGLTPRATLLQPGLEGLGNPPQPDWLSVPTADRRPTLVADARRLFGAIDRPPVRIFAPEGPGGDYLLARLRYDWAPIGIMVERASSPASADLVWIDEVAPSTSPAWFLRRFRCEVTPICSEEAEPLLVAARAAPDAAQRAALFQQAAELMDEAQLFIPVAAPIRWSLVSGQVPGFSENPFARHTLVGLTDTRISERMR